MFSPSETFIYVVRRLMESAPMDHNFGKFLECGCTSLHKKVFM